MLVALFFAAALTAGLVNRVVERSLTGLVGRRAVPRRDHVVVVGLGQVGMRLCLLLRACRIPLVAVESDEHGESVGIAKELGLPVVIGRGADPSVLRPALAAQGARGRRGDLRRPREHLRRDDGARDPPGHPHGAARRRRAASPTRRARCSRSGSSATSTGWPPACSRSKILGGDAESVVCIGDDAHLRFPDGRLERAELDVLAG